MFEEFIWSVIHHCSINRASLTYLHTPELMEQNTALSCPPYLVDFLHSCSDDVSGEGWRVSEHLQWLLMVWGGVPEGNGTHHKLKEVTLR